MKKETLVTDRYLWNVTGDLLYGESLEPKRIQLNVLAESLEYAIEAVRVEYPNIRILYCHQENKVHLIVE